MSSKLRLWLFISKNKALVLFSALFIIIKLKNTASWNEKQPSVETDFNLFIKESQSPNSHDFAFTMNPAERICGVDRGKSLVAVIFVLTEPSDFGIRQQIRLSWGEMNTNRRFKVVFLLGLANQSYMNTLLQNELAKYGDLVQEDFVDSYSNLTLKTMMYNV